MIASPPLNNLGSLVSSCCPALLKTTHHQHDETVSMHNADIYRSVQDPVSFVRRRQLILPHLETPGRDHRTA